MIDDDLKACEDIDWNEQQASAFGQGIMRILACCEEILRDDKEYEEEAEK